MNDGVCEWAGCGRQAGRGWDVDGKSYCGPHYFPGLEKAFLEEYAKWDGASEPTDNFKNLFSRYAERLYPAGGMPDKLSRGRIEMRAAAWKKIPSGLEFSVERHRTAYRWSGPVRTVNQQWRFGLQTKDLLLVRQQDVPTRKLSWFSTISRAPTPATSGVSS
jgi:hypothetical protein